MRIGSAPDFIDILELERAPQGVPDEGDVRVSVQVSLGQFCGSYDAVWLEASALRDFIACLERVEADRQGGVTLASCSPDEFVLQIRSHGALGHFVAEVSLCRHRYAGGVSWPTTVSGGFDIDPGALPSLLIDFRNLHIPNI